MIDELISFLYWTVVVSMDVDLVSMKNLKFVLAVLMFFQNIHFDMVPFFSDMEFVFLEAVHLILIYI